jgi:outer membrane protein OmpA-like peptidoglycan-associated protein
MKMKYLAAALVASALVGACAYVPPKEGETRRVSPDFNATGTVEGVRAFNQGATTIVEFDSEPAFLSIRDENGATVEYERSGRFARLDRQLDTFTVWANGRSMTFAAPVTTRVFSSQQKAAEKPQAAPPAPDFAAMRADYELLMLLKLSQQQLGEVRKLLEKANADPSNSGAMLFEAQNRLDDIERRLAKSSAVLVSVKFPTAGTKFSPAPEVAKVLIANAKAADRVMVHGHTDAKVAGRMDAKIAEGRAESARKFLVDNGVPANKITVQSTAEGEFIAPNVTKEGRALNRRVDIEIVSARLAELTGRTAKLATLKK